MSKQKYANARQTVESVKRQIDRNGPRDIHQTDLMLVIVSMLIDIAEALQLGVQSIEIVNPGDLVS